MKTPRPLPKRLLVGMVFLIVLLLHPQDATGQSPEPVSPPQRENADNAALIDITTRLGPFAIGGEAYAVVVREKSIADADYAPYATTVAGLEIREADETVIYQESFPYEIVDSYFARKLSASASLLTGAGGAALVIRYVEESAAGGSESWQVFGPVNGELASYGAPLPLGQGSGIAVGGVLTGVMVRGGIGVVPLASTAEPLEFRAWTGNFFVYVPVRVDWAQGQWGQGEQCFELIPGGLRQRGCNLRVEINARPSADGFVTLYAEPTQDRFTAQYVAVRADSPVEFLGAWAVVDWNTNGERVTCNFDDVWLRIRLDGSEGWVHSDPDFAALGLPAASPPP